MNDPMRQKVEALVDVMRNPNTPPDIKLECIDALLALCDSLDVSDLARPYEDEARSLLSALAKDAPP